MTGVHNVGKLPWASLDETIYLYEKKSGDLVYRVKNYKTILHFSEVFDRMIEEYMNTAATDDVKEYNPSLWGHCVYSYGGCFGARSNLTSIYIILNLYLIDPRKYRHMIESNGQVQWTYQVCNGHCDGGHPDFMAERFKEIFYMMFPNRKGKGSYIWSDDKKLSMVLPTEECVGLIKQYLKDIFRCMYNLNRTLSISDAETTIVKFLDVRDALSALYDN